MRSLPLSAAMAALAGTAGAQPAAPAPDSLIVPISNDTGPLDGFRRLEERIGTLGQITIRQDDPEATVALKALIDVNTAGPGASGKLIPTAQAEKSSAELMSRIVGERPESASALSFFRDRLKRDNLPALASSGGWAAAATGEFYVSSVAPMTPTVNGGAGLVAERAKASGVNMSWAQIQLLPDPDRLEKAASRAARFRGFSEQYRQTLASLATFMSQPNNAAAKLEAVDQARNTYAKFVENWDFYETDPDARALAVRALDGISRQSELKSVYGVKSSFQPDSYRSIFLQSARIVIINDDKGMPICSGMAVTPEWILTAGHCFISQAWQAMSVRFSASGGNTLSVPLPIEDAWPNPPKGSLAADETDFAFIRVVPPQTVVDTFRKMEQDLAAAGNRTLCLRERPGVYEEPVLAIAQAGNDKLVYDHAYIWYPFQLYPSELKRVTAMTGIRLQRLSEAFYPGDKTGQVKFFDENLQGFKAAYARQVGSGNQQRSAYYAQPREASVVRPMFGFDTDTQHGNSGAPVFSRMDGCLLGVFGGGRPDGVVITEASWREHEFATPVTVIIDAMGLAANAVSPAALDDVSLKRRALVAALTAATSP